MKIVAVIGARPQFIKASAVSRAFKESSGFKDLLVHTGQHFDANMSNVFFDELGIPRPDYNLGIHGGGHGAQTGRMLEALEEVLKKERPCQVIVYGDTNSTLAGALAASKLHIPVAHVEAGLRSFNRRMPEEINRVMTDHVSDLLLAPTEASVVNLRNEGLTGDKVCQVGDVMYDVALFYGEKAEAISQILRKLGLDSGGYVLATIHRAENTDDPLRLKAIFEGLCEISQDLPVVVPLHPRTRKSLFGLGWALPVTGSKMKIIDPVGYLDMVKLEKNACVIVTDSGGVQKEAFFHRVPCVTLRGETEWVELVALGWNLLVPPKSAAVVAEGVREGLVLKGEDSNCYGDGNAAQKIVDLMINRN